VYGSGSYFLENVRDTLFLERLRHNGRSGIHRCCEGGGDRDYMTLGVIYSKPGQILPIGEALYRSLERLNRVSLEIAFNISRQALPQHLGTPLEIAPQGALLHNDFVVGSAKRNQRDTDNERNYEPGTQQSHAKDPQR
jgi:hypothetical protein